MQINRTTVPGSGVLHDFVTRDGERFGVLIDADDNRHLLTYGGSDLDVPTRAVVLEPDEADRVAEILQDQPVADWLIRLERRLDELIGKRGR